MRIKIFSMVLILCLLPAACAFASNAPELKQEFISLYNSEWRSSNFNYELFRMLNEEFDLITHSMLYGTRGFRLAINNNKVVERILDDIFARFQPEYELFFKDFYDKYYTVLDTNPEKYSREKLKSILFYEKVANLQPEEWQKTLDNAPKLFVKKISTPYLAIVVLTLGFLIIIFRSVISKLLSAVIDRNERRIRFMVDIAGFIVIIAGTLQFTIWLSFVQGTARDFIFEEAKLFYTSKLPDTFWSYIEPYVVAALN